MQARYRRLIQTEHGGLGLPVIRGITTKLDASGLRLDHAGNGAFGNAMALPAGRSTQHGNDKLGKLRGSVYHRLGDRTEAALASFIANEMFRRPLA